MEWCGVLSFLTITISAWNQETLFEVQTVGNVLQVIQFTGVMKGDVDQFVFPDRGNDHAV